MRKLFPMLAVAIVFSGLTLIVRAADEKTVTGSTECAKCTLSETKACQNALTVEEGGKKVTYYLAQNDVAKKNHRALFCQGSKKAKVTGTVENKDGKMVMTATKIEEVKD